MSQSWLEYWDELVDVLARQFQRNRVEWSDHALQQMNDRSISKRSVQFVIEHCLPDEMYAAHEYAHGPHPHTNPDPVFSVTGRDVPGNWITVAVAVQRMGPGKLHFVIVTVLEPSTNSRHRKSK